jgi:hypothetical protein
LRNGGKEWVGGWSKGHSLIQRGGPGDAQLNIVELQGHQRQGQEVVLAEEKLQWEKWTLLVGGAVGVKIQVPGGIGLCAHNWLNIGCPLEILGIHNLTSDQQLNLVNAL